MSDREPPLQKAFSVRNAITDVARALDITVAAVSNWRRVPRKHLAEVSKIVSMSERELRPDLFLFEEKTNGE